MHMCMHMHVQDYVHMHTHMHGHMQTEAQAQVRPAIMLPPFGMWQYLCFHSLQHATSGE